MPLKILVTGASGFVGRNVCASLSEAGHSVTGIGRGTGTSYAVDDWVVADLLQSSSHKMLFAGRRFDRVVHLAWTVEPGKFWTDARNLDWVAATLSLVKTAHLAGVSHVTVAGTCYEYDWPNDGDCSEDTTPTAAHTLYDVSKDATHRILVEYARQNGFELSWVRLFSLFGRGEHPDRLVSSVAASLTNGVPARTSGGQALRDFMDVRDVGRAIATVAITGSTGPINIASGQCIRIADVVRRLGELSGRPELLRLGALPDRQEPPRITADIKRLRACGFVPMYTLNQGLTDVINSHRLK